MPLKTVVKIKQIPINPYSSGERRHANTKPTMKVTPCPRKASAALHPTPFIVFFFNDSCYIYLVYGLFVDYKIVLLS